MDGRMVRARREPGEPLAVVHDGVMMANAVDGMVDGGGTASGPRLERENKTDRKTEKRTA